MSLSVIPPTAFKRTRIGHFLVLELLELFGESFDRALDVGFQDQVEALELLLGHLAVEVLQRDGLAIGVGGVAGADPAGLGDLAGAGDVVDHAEVLAGAGDDIEARDLDGGRGPAWSIARPLSLKSARTRPKPSPQTITSPTRSVPPGPGRVATHAAALGERRLKARAGRRAGRVGLELVQLGDRLERGQKLGDALAGRRRGLDDLDVATPFDGVQPLLSTARRRSC